MKRLLALLLMALLAGTASAQEKKFASDQGVPDQKFKRGGQRTPPAEIAKAVAAGKVLVFAPLRAAPAQVNMIPPRTSVWGNDRYGDCVTAQEACSIGAYSKKVLGDAGQIFITESEVISWASRHGVLNGADLLNVMQMMARDGIKDENGKLWKDGVPSVVDYKTETHLQGALAEGPVNIAIAADSLPNGAGNKSGWWSFTASSRSTDHCVPLLGYGPADFIFGLFKMPVPAGIDPKRTCYLLFTWNTVGIVGIEWLRGTCDEAWLRTPTVLGLPSPPPDPPAPGPGSFGAIRFTLDRDTKAGVYDFKLVGPNEEVNELGTKAKLDDAVNKLADAVKTIEELHSRLKKSEALPIEKKPEPKEEKKQDARDTIFQIDMTFAEWQSEAKKATAPLVVGIGCDPPKGNWLSFRAESPWGDFASPCIIGFWNENGVLWRTPIMTVDSDVTAVLQKLRPDKKWNPYANPRDPKTGATLKKAA